MASFGKAMHNLVQSGPLWKEASASGNLKVLSSLLGPAYRGLVLQGGRGRGFTHMPAAHQAHFDWGYLRDHAPLARAVRGSQDVAVEFHDRPRLEDGGGPRPPDAAPRPG